MQTQIKHIESGEILDSRGNPTVMSTVVLASGACGSAAVPSGASRGSLEAHELRDNAADRYDGLGVLKACSNVNVKIAEKLSGMDAEDQRALDDAMIELDGTENKSNLGANAILSVSLAAARAVSVARKMPLFLSLRQTFDLPDSKRFPIPIMNVVNGGAHASTNLLLQEFQILPLLGETETASEKIQAGSEIFHELGEILKKESMDSDVGNEGGYAPDVESIESVFEKLCQAVQNTGFELGRDVGLGIDAAANSFYSAKEDNYTIAPPKRTLNSEELNKLYFDWIEKYHILTLEDPFDEKAWKSWIRFNGQAVPSKVIVIGDDLLVTNKSRLQEAIGKKAVGGILIKPNQVGSLSETMDTIKLAQENDIKVAVSHRSGETNDAFIADLAVAVGSEFIKAGAPSRGERVAKYNKLMEIEKYT